MRTAELKVQERILNNKSENRRLRREGFVPAIVYGPEAENMGCAFDERDLKRTFKGHMNLNTILTLTSDSPKLNGRKVILKAIERDPVRWSYDHVDFYQISEKRPLTVKVPFEFQGTPVGVKLGGGILQVIRREVAIEALPHVIPEKIIVDIAGLELNNSLHIGEIKMPDGLKILDSLDYAIVSVSEPEKEEAPAPTTAAAPAEGAAAAPGTGAAAATGTAAAAPAAEAKK